MRNQDKAFTNFFAKHIRYPKYKKRQSAQAIRFQIDQRVAVNYFRTGELLKSSICSGLQDEWIFSASGYGGVSYPSCPSSHQVMSPLGRSGSDFVFFSCHRDH
ncbi:hypothetical protein CCP3SC5AM1_1150005 [Gammaproteobacteria bacterium]